MKLRELLHLLGGRISSEQDLEKEITGLTTLEKGGENCISFFNGARYYQPYLENTSAGIIVISAKSEKHLKTLNKLYIVVDDPYLYFAHLSHLFAPPSVCQATPYRHPSAVVSPSAVIADRVYVSPGVVIGDGVSVGPDTYLGPGVVLMDRVSLGAGCVLHAHVVVYQECTIGDRTIIHASSVIGADGFGYARTPEREWLKIMQTGTVRIGADCEIGACVTIDRGAIDDTMIGCGVKIDNQTQIGHNCHIGDHAILSGHVSLAGSVRLGKYCRLGGASGVLGPIDVEEGTDLSGASFLAKVEEGVKQYASCIPAIDSLTWFRRLHGLDRLTEVLKQVQRLSQQVDKLMAQQGEEVHDQSR